MRRTRTQAHAHHTRTTRKLRANCEQIASKLRANHLVTTKLIRTFALMEQLLYAIIAIISGLVLNQYTRHKKH